MKLVRDYNDGEVYDRFKHIIKDYAEQRFFLFILYTYIFFLFFFSWLNWYYIDGLEMHVDELFIYFLI